MNVGLKKLFMLIIFVFGFVAAAQLELLPSSAVTYTASDPSGSWSGQAPVAELDFTLDPENIRAARLSVTVHPGKFDSGNFIRDANARRVVFETGKYPDIRFELERVQSRANRLADGETAQLELTGILTMHGVSREVSTSATVSRAGATFRATGVLDVKLGDYDMKRPTFFGTSVDDAVHVAFDIQAQGLP